jgi:acyl carrier protein
VIADKVKSALGRELKRDPDTIEMSHLLREDLGLNSLDAIELMFKVEEEFDLEIPDADLQKLKTVGDLVAYLETRLERSGAPSVLGPARSVAAAPELLADAPATPPPSAKVARPAPAKKPAVAAPKRTAKRRPS